jgi:REP-associated tyrosine transposase
MSPQVSWPHAPAHFFDRAGTFIVTAATYKRAHLFRTHSKLMFLQNALFSFAEEHGLALKAWSIFSNHYHFVAQVSAPHRLPEMLRKLHSITAGELNSRDGERGRKVWFHFRETHITYERSYFARLHYVHRNPVRHRIVREATLYPWCSAAWFQREAPLPFQRSVYSTRCEGIRIADEFEVVEPEDEKEEG